MAPGIPQAFEVLKDLIVPPTFTITTASVTNICGRARGQLIGRKRWSLRGPNVPALVLEIEGVEGEMWRRWRRVSKGR
jgi:hypothetical protein